MMAFGLGSTQPPTPVFIAAMPYPRICCVTSVHTKLVSWRSILMKPPISGVPRFDTFAVVMVSPTFMANIAGGGYPEQPVNRAGAAVNPVHLNGCVPFL